MSETDSNKKKEEDSKSKKLNLIRSLVDIPVENLSKVTTIALGKPKSKRFSQLSFEGFRPQGKNHLEKNLNVLKEFNVFLYKYSRKKTLRFAALFKDLALLFVIWSREFKSWSVKKLIWSRGKLGRPIATAIVTSAAFLVFMVGEVFNSSKFINTQEIHPEYLSNISDIIPRKSVALTTIPEDRKKSEPFTYVVEGGDTLSSIGNKFKISTDAIKYVNGLTDNSVLRVGQELVIPPVSGLIHTVKSGESLENIASKYSVPAQAIADFNYILNTSSLEVGSELVIPGAKVPETVQVPALATFIPPAVPTIDPNAGGNWCIWPTTGRIVTQYFSWYHNGVDIAESGWLPPIYACGTGVVTRAGWDPFGLGLHVRIDHGNGYETVYGHLSRLDVGYGQSVSQGAVIGVMGSTGRSTGPHVHFTVTYNGVSQNPMNYIR